MDDVVSSLDETACRRFEAEWRGAALGELGAFLPPEGPRRLPTLIELVCIDLERRWRRRAAGGPEPPRVEDYAVAYPTLNDEKILHELVRQEAVLRSRADENGSGDYRKRFPNLNAEAMSLGLDDSPPKFVRLPRIPGCDIIRELGRGGMGVVYLANQLALNRLVAIKTIRHAAEAGPQELARFHHEAESVARLHHANIVPIHSIGTDAEMPYFVLEYVDGGSLAERLALGPMPASEAAALVETLARAMEYAHQRGVIHRDLKPANILMQQGDGPARPMITDFGLAKTPNAKLTQTGYMLGTPSYMAPEQASGQSSQISTRTDVHALGIILYEALTGRTPFEGDSIVTTLDAVRTLEARPPGQLKSGVSRDLETICLHCLNKDPARRYASAELLAEDLHRYLTHQPIKARRIGVMGIAARWCRRKPALAGTLAASLLVIAGVSTLGIWNVLHERIKFRTERDRAEANLYDSLVTQATSQIDSHSGDWWWKATDTLAQAGRMEIPQRNRDDLRRQYLRCLGTPYYSLRVTATWPGGCPKPQRIAISGDTIATVDASGLIEIRSLKDGKLLRSWPGDAKPVGLAFHPTLPILLAAFADGQLKSLHLDHDGVTIWTRPQRQELSTLAVHPKGERILLGTEDGQVLSLTMNADGVATLRPGEFAFESDAITGLAFSADGSEFAVADKAKDIAGYGYDDALEHWSFRAMNPSVQLRYDATGTILFHIDPLGFGFGIFHIPPKNPLAFLQLHDNAVRRVIPHKRGFITASFDGTIRIWGRESGRNIVEWTRGAADFGPIVDLEQYGEDTFAAIYRDGTIRVWQVYEPAERFFFAGATPSVSTVNDAPLIFDGFLITDLTRQLTVKQISPADQHRVGIWAVAAEGRWLASGAHNGMVKVFDAETMNPVATFSDLTDLAWTVAFRPGTAILAGASSKIILWDVEHRELIMVLDGHEKLTNSVVFHPKLPVLASAGRDGYVRLWNLDTRKMMAEYGPLPAYANSLAIDPEGEWLAAGCDDGRVLVWNVNSLEQTLKLAAPVHTIAAATTPVRAVAFSHCGWLAAGAEQGMVPLYNARAEFRPIAVLQGGKGQVRSLAFSRDDRYLTCGFYVSQAMAWDVTAVRRSLAAAGLDW